MERLAPILLLCTIACGSGSPHATESSAKGTAIAEGASHTLRAADAGSSRSISVGDRVIVELSGASMGVAPEYRFTWGDAAVVGSAVRFVERRDVAPPDDIDGGSYTHVYELHAREPGHAKITIGIADRGAEADATPWEVELTVIASE